jgi:two-component system LytT family response regulator
MDDELPSRAIIADYIKNIPALHLIGEYDDYGLCFDTHDFDTLDILLLCIHATDGDAIQLARAISKNKTSVILVSNVGKPSTGIFNLNITDHLVKPVLFEHLKKSIEKTKKIISSNASQNSIQENEVIKKKNLTPTQYFFVKSDYKIVKININDILYIEGLNEYVRIYLTKGKPVVTLLSLRKIEDFLPTPPFFRVHRSHIVNVDLLEAIHQRNIIIAGKELGIGKNYEEAFLDYVNSHSIF